MNHVISALAVKLTIDKSLVRKAVGMVLALLRKQGDKIAVDELFEKLPGASDLAEQYADSNRAGSIGGMLGGLMGGGAGEAMKLVGALQSEGLSTGQIKAIVAGLLDHAKAEAGEELVRRAVNAIPGVSDHI